MQSDIVQRLNYIAAILEANKDKFTVPGHIPAKVKTVREAASEITRLTEALCAAEEREKGLRGLLPHFDRLALAVAQFGPHSGFHDWWTDAKEYRAALKGPSHADA